MKINSVKLRQFRNLGNVDLTFEKNINVFTGNNGQGKTNFIEALVYLSSGRSFRLQNDINLIQNEKEFAEIKAELLKKQKSIKLRAVVSDMGKYFQVDQQSISLMSDFIGYCNVVLFNPDDLQFFTSTPSKRRREIDFELGKISKNYMTHLSTATKLLSERNAYLKTRSLDHDYLKIISDQLVEESKYIIKLRSALIKKIEPMVNEKYQYLSESKSKIEIEYKTSISDINNIKIELLEKMKSSLQRDLDFKMTHVGIHRDDYIFKMNGMPVSNVASQGQKRMIILAYKLALVDLIHSSQKEYPILCLDDLFSELDKSRRKRVLTALDRELQVFITSTDKEFIEITENVTVFKVIEGEINREVSA